MIPTAEEHYARRARLGAPIMRVAVVSSPVIARVHALLAAAPALPPAPIAEIFPDDKPPPKINMTERARRIISMVAERHGFTVIDLKSERRAAPLVLARFEAMYFIKRHTTWSYPRIGNFFGGREHTSVMNAIRRYEALLRGEKFNRKEYYASRKSTPANNLWVTSEKDGRLDANSVIIIELSGPEDACNISPAPNHQDHRGI